jgi:toxin ParE1/3/4
MAKYKLTNRRIWDYTFGKWSEKQADKYYEMLLENFQHIADDPNIGENYEGIKDELFGLKANRHIIFNRKSNNNGLEKQNKRIKTAANN